MTQSVADRLGVDEATVQRARALHASALVIDGSAVVFRRDQPVPIRWDRWTAGGVTATNHTVTDPDADLPDALAQINDCRRWIDANPDKVLLVESVADIHRAKTEGRGGVIFGPQDSAFLDRDPGRVGTFYDLGVRIMQLTYQGRNMIGDGCGETSPGGLSKLGAKVVKEMDEIGMVIDLSHCSHPTSFDTIEKARGPVIFSHAHPDAITPHIRAKNDDVLRALAAKGGVIGVTALSAFVKLEYGVRPTLRDLVHHIEYLVDLIGPDHVGIGFDFDETKSEAEHDAFYLKYPEFAALKAEFNRDLSHQLVEDVTSGAEAPHVTMALMAAGYDDETIRKILGLNFLRVFTEVWKG